MKKMKKFIIVPALLLAIGGGYLLAQTGLLSGNAEKQEMITAAAAKEIALDLYPGTIVSFDFDNDDRKPHYDIEITSETEKVDIEVDAVSSNAVITEREAIGQDNDDKDQATALENAKISQDDAIAIAMKQFNGALHEVDIDEDDNRFVYDIELRSATEKAEFEIDTQTGEVLKFETKKLTNNDATGSQNNVNNSSNGSSNNSSTQQAQKSSTPQLVISLDQAKEIALSKAAGTVVKAELDDDDLVYEIEIRNGKMEYDFEIDAKSGAVLSYEEDLDDDND